MKRMNEGIRTGDYEMEDSVVNERSIEDQERREEYPFERRRERL